MTATTRFLAESPSIDLLQGLEPRLAQMDRRELAEGLAPVLVRLQERLPDAERARVAESAFAFCRRLYSNGRSGDGLALARSVLAQSILADDAALERRASSVCGLLAADTADVVGAIDYQARALALADASRDPTARATAWNNIGLAFGVAGNYSLAVQCYRRALTAEEQVPGAVRSRYTASNNLSIGLYLTGDFAAALRFGELALQAVDPSFVDENPHSAILLRRNLARLYVSAGRMAEAAEQVAEVAVLAAKSSSPRSLIAAATTRATYELATGHTDIALTRLEEALERARGIPATLRDTLGCVIHAEEAAGNAERALVRLRELSDHVYRFAVDRALDHLELAALCEGPSRGADARQEQARARLVSHLRPPGEPEEWKAFQRLSVAAVLRMDNTGWHGLRVGALTKALALACGCAPLQALEIGLAAELHDIGLASVPEGILSRKGALNGAERGLLERHADAGAEILRDDRHPRILMAREIAKYHHARWDGAGYPSRVGGKFIPLHARMCAVADAYDEMVCGLGAHRAMTMNEALEALRRESGGQFDPDLVNRFEAVIRDETADRGIDPSTTAGLESFQELVNSLQEDRGFL
ncbi:MAG: HD domain-containing protein [Betaproteobacteria bacterium]|nr:HD domain-containing protein [Betaproteobacteria bacterium]